MATSMYVSRAVERLLGAVVAFLNATRVNLSSPGSFTHRTPGTQRAKSEFRNLRVTDAFADGGKVQSLTPAPRLRSKAISSADSPCEAKFERPEPSSASPCLRGFPGCVLLQQRCKSYRKWTAIALPILLASLFT